MHSLHTRPCLRVPCGAHHLGRRSSVARASMAQAAANPAATTSFKQGVTYTYYGGNSFHLKFQATGVRVLVDPWLVGDLTFGSGLGWLYRGTREGRKIVDVPEVVADTDLLIVSQGLDDHCHMPTLRALPRTMPVLAQEVAAQKIKGLGFQNVIVIKPGQKVAMLEGRLQVQATLGALVGPPGSQRQLGLVMRETSPESEPGLHHASVYYEAHCDFDAASVSAVGPVDVVISPARSVLLKVGPLAYPILSGDINLDKLMGLLRPRVLLPLLNDEVVQDGLMAAAVVSRGDISQVQGRLAKAGLATRGEMPAPLGEALSIAL